MATKPLVINNTTYNYPGTGEDPGWGDDATGWAEAVTGVLNTLLSSGDLLETTFNIANNISASTNVVGLSFDTATVRAAVIDYSIYRISSTNASGQSETGQLFIVYDNSASSGNQWLLSRETNGDAGVNFDITDSGQFTYTSNDIGATGYSGVMKFKAKTLSQ